MVNSGGSGSGDGSGGGSGVVDSRGGKTVLGAGGGGGGGVVPFKRVRFSTSYFSEGAA